MSLLKVAELETYIGQFHILQGVNFSVEEGKITVIFGRNGAGKTTALRSIMGFHSRIKGEIRFNDDRIDGLNTFQIARKGIGYVPEDQGMFAGLTVGETLILSKKKDDSATNEKMDWMLELFPDLKTFWNKKSGLLSGGQKQMLAIARAYVNSGGLLLIDEPSKGLSPIMVEKLMESILEMKKKTTILLVEQNFLMASRIGDHFFIMDDGKIVEKGLMSELVEDKEMCMKYLGIA